MCSTMWQHNRASQHGRWCTVMMLVQCERDIVDDVTAIDGMRSNGQEYVRINDMTGQVRSMSGEGVRSDVSL